MGDRLPDVASIGSLLIRKRILCQPGNQILLGVLCFIWQHSVGALGDLVCPGPYSWVGLAMQETEGACGCVGL